MVCMTRFDVVRQQLCTKLAVALHGLLGNLSKSSVVMQHICDSKQLCLLHFPTDIGHSVKVDIAGQSFQCGRNRDSIRIL